MDANLSSLPTPNLHRFPSNMICVVNRLLSTDSYPWYTDTHIHMSSDLDSGACNCFHSVPSTKVRITALGGKPWVMGLLKTWTTPSHSHHGLVHREPTAKWPYDGPTNDPIIMLNKSLQHVIGDRSRYLHRVSFISGGPTGR